MRGRTALAAGLIVLLTVAGAATAAWVLWDGSASPESMDAVAAAAAAPSAKPNVVRRGLRRRPTSEPAVDVEAELKAAWDAAVALYKAGKPVEALASLAQLRKDHPEWFAEPSRAALLAEMERAALAALARAVRTKSLAEVRILAAALAAAVQDPQLLQQAADLVAAAERRAKAAQISVGAEVIEHADLLADKQALTRHLQRFADRGAAPKTKDWVDVQLGALEAANKALAKEPDPLPIPDPSEAETRRLDQLDKLRQRNTLGVLDPIGGALAWLALHQADDGHYGADATVARCKALGHDPCVASGNEYYPLAATGLAVLAFLDFRDQDVKRLFEPSLARGLRWMIDQQQPDGSFKPPGRQGYAAAIGLMALGQAAASTREKALVNAVQRGIDFYAKHHGAEGGYWYVLDPKTELQQDLSVTGWYVQAVEAAKNAGAKVPEEMTQGLDRFLNYVTVGRHQFVYRIGEAEKKTLNPVGMLVASILRPDSPRQFGDDWREFLSTSQLAKDNVYFLYYGVRVYLFLDGKLPDRWRTFLNDLAGKQQVKGGAAGMIPLEKEWSFRSDNRVGPTIATAFATLTLEHSLYRR